MDATTTLSTIMGSVVSTSVDLATTVITTYWPFVLVIGIIAGLIGVFSRLARIGIHK
jgi:H+/Cl- antiporter ClcA